MAITSTDVTIFLDLLDTDRKATARLRKMILPDEPLQRVEANLAEISVAQKRTEVHLAALAQAQVRTEARVADLAQAQERTEARVADLAQAQERTEARVADLAQAQERTEARVADLAQAQERTETALERLTGEHAKTRDQLGKVRGNTLELRYRDHLPSFLGRRLSGAEALLPNAVLDTIETRLPSAAVDDVLLVDLLIRGRRRGHSESGELWLVTEVSAVIDKRDIERAARRAAHLRQAGLIAIPAVAGEDMTRGARAAMTEAGVVVVLGGRVENWDNALSRHVGAAGG